MKFSISIFAGAFLLSAGAFDDISFRSPKSENHPETWFHLIGGNVSKAGMSADLDAIASVGISGIQLFHGQFGGAWPGVEPQIPCLGKDWDDMIRFVADGCKARGLTFKMQNCPGWSMSGGPWIAPSNAMRNLTYSRTDIEGGKRVCLELAVPRLPAPEIKLSDEDRDYRDLFVLAFPTPADDDPEYLEPSSMRTERYEDRLVLTYRFDRPVTIRSFELPPPRQFNPQWTYSPDAKVELCAAYDGEDAVKVAIEDDIPQGCWQDAVPLTFSVFGGKNSTKSDLPPADTWRLTISHKHPLAIKPSVRFSEGVRLNNWQGKAGWVLRGLGVSAGGGGDSRFFVRRESIVDITGHYVDGRLDWTPPPGKWTILRIGHVNNGSKNGPAPLEATGWECNKLDAAGIDAHLAAYIGRLVDGPLSGGRLNGFVVDSWECRRQTWSANLERDFRALRGYDFRKMLPAVFGWVLDSPDATESFLRDWRQTLGELVERNYYARMSEFARRNGLSVQYETAFGDVLPGDMLSFWKYCDTPMCEFWFPRAEVSVGSDDYKPVLPCASSAHVYGKRHVAAESFTTMRLRWDEDLKRLKACANHAFSRGVTHLVLHTYTHNPRTDWKLPGTSFGTNIGTPFIRGQTWWRFMPEFTKWAARCGTMLERGLPANDILWFLGEDVGHKPSERSPFPNGYKYDYVNRDALLNRIAVKDGLFTTPAGVTWKFLWAPRGGYVSEAVTNRLKEFESAGGKVITESVVGMNGLRTVPWDVVRRQVPDMELPDVECGPDANGRVLGDWRKGEMPVEWIHRRDADEDWYFVSANGMDSYEGDVTFRMDGAVSVLDPVAGSRSVPHFRRTEDGRTTVRLNLAPAESLFVVFSHTGGKAVNGAPGMNREKGSGVVRKLSEWTVSFPAGWGAPETLKISELCPWAELPISDEGRHFSGTAAYRTTLDCVAGGSTELDLGEVETAAEVFLNGESIRKLWAPPYRCEIGPFLKEGKNELRVDVTSTWFNRLAYDSGLPEARRKTWTIAAPPAGTAPMKAGLLGPVTLRIR